MSSETWRGNIYTGYTVGCLFTHSRYRDIKITLIIWREQINNIIVCRNILRTYRIITSVTNTK